MRILLIGQGESPHTARTVQLTKIHYPNAVLDIFRSTPFAYSPFLNSVAQCHEAGGKLPAHVDFYWTELYLNPTTPYSSDPTLLARLLRQEQFDFIHVLAMQE